MSGRGGGGCGGGREVMEVMEAMEAGERLWGGMGGTSVFSLLLNGYKGIFKIVLFYK